MLVPLSWLKEYVDISLEPEALAHALTMAGLETAVAASPVPVIPGVITARIDKIEPHSQAEKLTVCQVRPRPDAPPLTIVCGATNITEGDIVPLAQPGAVLPDGQTLRKTKIRGVESEGMMCSERELGIGEDHAGIWILPPHTPIGLPLHQALAGKDVILETDPTPNRGDLLSLLGLAREIAAITGGKVRLPEIRLREDGPAIGDLARVEIEDFEGCPRYAARLLRGIKIGPSPAWLAERLEACGMRALNNVVDVTNFVMLELGQPLHAFDFNRLRRHRIVVRRALPDETITTLDGQERKLPDGALLICDGVGPVAIAGVMGGQESEVTEGTVDVLIESACFKPEVIRRTARLLGLPTEASRRFDKGVDPWGTVFAADRAAALIQELAGGVVCRGVLDVRRELFQPPRLTLRPERLNQVLGVSLSAERQVEILSRLDGLKASVTGAQIEAVPPSYRPDLTGEHDLFEEVARLMGYDAIPAALPSMTMQPLPRSQGRELARRIRERMAALGFTEVILTNFEDPGALAALGLPPDDPRHRTVLLQNPLATNESLLRSTLLPKLLACLQLNRRRGFTGPILIYELGAVFENADEELPLQRGRLAGVMSPALEKTLWAPGPEVDGFYEIKAVVEQIAAAVRFPGARLEAEPEPPPFLHPVKAARLMLGAEPAGQLGELHPRTAEAFDLRGAVFLFELNFDMLCERAGYVPKARTISRFPATLRDIAVVVEEKVTMGEVIRCAMGMKSPILESITLFDVFRGGAVPTGKKSMAFHVRYQSLERTLSDEEVNSEHKRLAEQLAKKLKAILR